MSTTANNDELVRLITEDPDVVDNWLLYADWLQEKGDPRGELITIDVALETASGARTALLEQSRAELVAKNAAALLGDTFSKVVAEGYGTITWHRGFVDEVSYVGSEGSHKRAVGWLIRAICDQPEPFLFLRSLKLAYTDLIDLEPITRFKSLIELDIADTFVVDIKPLAALPKLQSIQLRGCAVLKDAIAKLKERGVMVDKPFVVPHYRIPHGVVPNRRVLH